MIKLHPLTLGELFLEQLKTFPEKTPYFYSHHLTLDNKLSDIFLLAQSYFLALHEIGDCSKQPSAIIIQKENPHWHPLIFSLMAHKSEVFPFCSQENIYDLFQKLSESKAQMLLLPDLLYLEKIKILLQTDPRALQTVKNIIICNNHPLPLEYKNTSSDFKIWSLQELLESGHLLHQKYMNLFENKLNLLTEDDVVFSFYSKTNSYSHLQKTSFSHSHFIYGLENLKDALHDMESSFTQKNKAVSFLSPATASGLLELFLPYYFDISIHYSNSFEESFYALSQNEPDFLFLNPENLIKILKKGVFLNKKKTLEKTLGKKIKTVFILGSFTTPRFESFLENKKIKYLHSFSVPEAIGPLTISPVQLSVTQTLGRPIGDVEIKTEKGKILASSKAIGFIHGSPSETPFLDTQETGWLDPQGQLYLANRGENHLLTPKKLEQWLSSFPIVENFILSQTLPNEPGRGVFVLNREETISFAADKELIYSNFENLIKQPQVLGLIQSYVDEVNKSLPQDLKIMKFTILPFSWNTESGSLTPNLEAQKNVLYEKYSYYFDKLLD